MVATIMVAERSYIAKTQRIYAPMTERELDAAAHANLPSDDLASYFRQKAELQAEGRSWSCIQATLIDMIWPAVEDQTDDD